VCAKNGVGLRNSSRSRSILGRCDARQLTGCIFHRSTCILAFADDRVAILARVSDRFRRHFCMPFAA
jgi:hypothetical protein